MQLRDKNILLLGFNKIWCQVSLRIDNKNDQIELIFFDINTNKQGRYDFTFVALNVTPVVFITHDSNDSECNKYLRYSSMYIIIQNNMYVSSNNEKVLLF